MRRVSVIGATHEAIVLDEHIFHRARFIPSRGISLYQYGTHACIIIGVVADDHASWRGDKGSTRAGSREIAMANFHFGRASEVLHTITL